MKSLLLTNALICTPGAPCAEGHVLMENGVIRDVGSGAPLHGADEVLDLGGFTLAPG